MEKINTNIYFPAIRINLYYEGVLKSEFIGTEFTDL